MVMNLNIETLTYTILGVGVAVELLKRNNLNTNILAVVATILGALVYGGLSSFSVQTVIIGAVIGAASSGFYDVGEGLKRVGVLKDLFNKPKSTDEDFPTAK